jgi:hypothetical protein
VLQELIARTQRDYFEKGNIGEDTYNIRINRFGEMIRDINRQVPLIREQLAKVEKVKKKPTVKHKKAEFDKDMSKKEKIEKEDLLKLKKEKKRKIEEEKRKEKEKEFEKKKKAIEKKVRKLKDKDLEQITKDFLELERKSEKYKNPLDKALHKIRVYRKQKEIEKKLKKIAG